MAHATTVAAYIRQVKPDVGRVQLQKLLYYVQGWSLAWTGQRLFADDLQAWDLGPVVPAVYREEPAVDEPITANQRAIIEAVVHRYGGHSGKALIQQTHEEQPWRDAITAGGRNASITAAALLHEFSRQAMAGSGPIKPELALAEGSEAETRALTDAITETWAETLEILAR